MLKRKLAILALICALVFGVVSGVFANGQQDGSGAMESVTLRLGHIYDPSHAWHKGAVKAAEIIAEKTEGRITMEIFPSSQLGTEPELLEQTLFGSVDICEAGAGQLGTLFKPINVLEMPYTFRDNAHVLAFAKSDIAATLFEDFRKEFGGKIVGVSSWGIRQLTSNKPINTPADLEGFKLRVPEQTICVAYGKAMGANPTPIAYSEAYMALQQSVVDGLENPMSSIKAMKFYEVQKYINLTKHVTNCTFFVMNDAKFNSFNMEDQKILTDAFSEASELIVELLNKDDQDLVAFFESEGLTINQPDIDAFVKATASMPLEFSDWWSAYGDDLHSRIQAIK
ncbi:MAG: sialic acid TRAP transporter substrate-binding protein SiaP [Spirochaetales bacterium]|uniref:Sialic acid TRAP transporter substrate-binding protein SiaP n=1 Tax=Candidatus Thalassospirochaeta sargassi TaxID=3119039 RepID=A0AAJ1MM34_9SPIO|nr:sialic acid TRAP transporter substrate-binding protein SiaP [Spirochaetales bacterium]